MIDAFIFDVDGTLADTFPLILKAFNRFAFKYTGRKWSVAELVSKFGPTETDIIEAEVVPELRPEAIEYYYKAYEDCHDGTPFFGGIPELLSELEGLGKPLAVYTGKGRRSADITLDKLGIAKKFNPVITGDDVTRAKPHPEGILNIIEQWNIPPEKAAMVGDNHNDIIAGRAAGVFTIAALWHGYYNNELMSAEPDAAFEKPEDMLKWIRQGMNRR